MDKFPLYQDKKPVGELTIEREALYTWFDARCRFPGEGLWCAWAVGDQGELRLGVLEPCGDRASIRRRFSDRMTIPLGKLQRGELRPVRPEGTVEWRQADHPEQMFQTLWLREKLRGAGRVLIKEVGGHRFVAIPYDSRRPFPLARLFCLARICRINGDPYVVFAFDGKETPVFWN